jgi:hypothetical protein
VAVDVASVGRSRRRRNDRRYPRAAGRSTALRDLVASLDREMFDAYNGTTSTA